MTMGAASSIELPQTNHDLPIWYTNRLNDHSIIEQNDSKHSGWTSKEQGLPLPLNGNSKFKQMREEWERMKEV